ncbi:hypothetical protein HDU76_011498, partial [Blyttiomyces sp. JEL0837]
MSFPQLQPFTFTPPAPRPPPAPPNSQPSELDPSLPSRTLSSSSSSSAMNFEVSPEVPQPPSGGGSTSSKSSKSRPPATKRWSCEFCRQRKVKCDGGKPRCGFCVRKNVECVYMGLPRKERKLISPKRDDNEIPGLNHSSEDS